MLNYASVFLILNSLIIANALLSLNLKNPTTKYGYVYPNRGDPNKQIMYVLEGVDVLIHLAKVPKGYTSCKLISPDTEITHTLTPGANDIRSKVEFWTPDSNQEECGARIKNVTVNDSGRWRLKAINEDEDYKFQSFINLKVIKNFDRPNGNFIVRDGLNEEFNVTYLANYCEISSPKIYGDHNIFDNCLVDLENINSLYDGKWKANVGVYGKIDEVVLEPSVTVLEEYFDVGYNKDGAKYNLFCNLKNAPKPTEIAFCRFIKEGDQTGLRLNEGLSNGKYSYYGKSILEGDCGLTIENPATTDFVTWKCTVGLYRNKDEKLEIKQSIIPLSKNKKKRRSVPRAEEHLEEAFTAIEQPLILSIKTDFRIRYCIIQHPNGTLFSINKSFRNDEWTTTGDLNSGICGMTLFSSCINETGIWQFQIGQYDVNEMDQVEKIRVTVGKTALVALNKTLTATENKSLTIKCKSVTEIKAMTYCRFSLPDGQSFHINEKITDDKAIDGLYWYNGKGLNKGDCQVSIKKVNSNHFGKWVCGGEILNSKNLEDYDDIHVTQAEQDPLSIASISGIAVGSAVVLLTASGGLIYYRRRKRQPQRRQTYLSSSSHSSGEVTQFQRDDPIVTVEQERPSGEEIEMARIETSGAASTSRQESTIM